MVRRLIRWVVILVIAIAAAFGAAYGYLSWREDQATRAAASSVRPKPPMAAPVAASKFATMPCLIYHGHKSGVIAAAISPDGKLAATGGVEHNIRVWEIATGKEVRVLGGHSSTVNVLMFSHDGKLLLSGGDDQYVRIWGVEKGDLRAELRNPGTVRAATFMLDDKSVIVGAANGTLTVWDIDSEKQLEGYSSLPGGVISMALSPDGKLLATSLWDPGEADVWDVASKTQVKTVTGLAGPVPQVGFAADGKTLVTADMRGLKFWGSGESEPSLWVMKAQNVNAFALSRDGKWAWASGVSATHLIDLSSGEALTYVAAGPDTMHYAVLTPDDRLLLTGGGSEPTGEDWTAAKDADVKVFDTGAVIEWAVRTRALFPRPAVQTIPAK